MNQDPLKRYYQPVTEDAQRYADMVQTPGELSNKQDLTERTLRVLSVEDSKVAAEFLQRNLSHAGFALVFERVETPEAMKIALETREWDVILCDYSMPQFNAPAALALVKEMGFDIPFIIISGNIGEEVAVKMMQAGVHDYLLKDNLARLVPAIERQLEDAKNRQVQKQAEVALKASEAEMRSLFEAMTDVILVLDSEGRYLKIAQTNPTYLYKPSADLLGKTLHEIFPKAKADLFLAHIRQVLDDGQRSSIEYSLPINGLDMWFDGSVSPMSPDSVLWIARDITERKLAEEQLRLQLDFTEAITINLGEGVYAVDQSGRLIFMNPAAERALGWGRSELLGQSMHEVIHFQYADGRRRPAGECPLPGVLHSGEAIEVESDDFTRKDGSIFPVSYSSSPIITRGKAVGTVLAFRDITARKRAIEEMAQLNDQLESQRQRLNNIIVNVPGVVWEAWGEPDAATQRIDFVSDYVETMLGYSVEEWLSTPNFWLSIVHPDDRERTARAAAANFARGGQARLEFRWITKDGQAVWVESNSAVITDEEGRPAGLRGVNTDITERKRAEEGLRGAEEKYRSIFENAVEGIFQFAPDGRFMSVNPALADILGYASSEELIAHRTEIERQHYVDPNDRHRLEETLSKQGVITGFECEVFRKDLSKIWIVKNIRASRDADGSVLYYEGSVVDITERKLLEEQLRQAQKLEAVGQLAGGIAHDFNNLLTAINGYSQLTLMGLQPADPLRGNMEEIRKAGDRAAALTRQLLAFSRKQVLQPKVLDLNSAVSEIGKMLRRLIGEDIQLCTVLASDLGRIKSDPGQIEQILMNLAVNARDAMPQGGKLTLETQNVFVDESYLSQHIAVIPGSYVMLAVSDNGLGMDKQTQAHIFEPFFTTKELGKGTGLGLSTVYGIVKQSGGNIWVYSEIGQGTTFKIYLPRVDEEAQAYRPGTEVQEALEGRETILLAEDEEIVRSLMRDVLKGYGYDVLEAANGSAALILCERHPGPIHLMITDVVMPEMSGRELTEHLAGTHPEMKVLFMSGYTDDTIVRHGILESDIAFLQKPFTPQALAHRVREVLEGSYHNPDQAAPQAI
jgi:two-component system, cell cycle sensor histidine kinase and response regulator CckA